MKTFKEMCEDEEEKEMLGTSYTCGIRASQPEERIITYAEWGEAEKHADVHDMYIDWMVDHEQLQGRIEELEAVFAMQQTRLDKATKLWQDATGKHDTLPDLGVLLDWLMDGRAKLVEALLRLLQECELADEQGDLSSYVSGDTMVDARTLLKEIK